MLKSTPKEINAGVPQGAVIAPLLFNLFISDQLILPTTLVGDFVDNKAIIANSNVPKTTFFIIQDHLIFLQT